MMSTFCFVPSKTQHVQSVENIEFTLIYDYYFLRAGLHWYRKKSGRLLLASRRHDASRTSKYAGNHIADGLRSSPWKRAQTPGKMAHCLCGIDTHGKALVSLVHPSQIASLQPEKLAAHQILASTSIRGL
jgi:hypothetical protein